MNAFCTDTRLPFARPFSEIARYYRQRTKEFLLFSAAGFLPLLFCWVWVFGGLVALFAAVGFIAAFAAIALWMRRADSADARLLELVNAAVQTWEAPKTANASKPAPHVPKVEPTSISHRVYFSRYYSHPDMVGEKLAVLIDGRKVTFQRLEQAHARLDALRPRLESCYRYLEQERSLPGPLPVMRRPGRSLFGLPLSAPSRATSFLMSSSDPAMKLAPTTRSPTTFSSVQPLKLLPLRRSSWRNTW